MSSNNLINLLKETKKDYTDNINLIYKLMSQKKHHINDVIAVYDQKLHDLLKSKEPHSEIVNVVNKIRLMKIEHIDKLTSDYEKKYDLLKKKMDVLKIKLARYSQLITYFSTFDANMIGDKISELISQSEDQNYRFVEDDSIVISELDFLNNFVIPSDEKGIQTIIENGKAVVIPQDENHNTSFYTYDKGIKNNVNYGNFTYVKDFIDDLIEYRFKNQIISFNNSNLEDFYILYMKNKQEKEDPTR